MTERINDRRTFLKAASTGGIAAWASSLAFPSHLPLVAADETNVSPNMVQFDEQIEPLVRLIEQTPRERLLEQVGHRIRNGSSYREVLAALLLAGIRNVQPRPSVGFKFHCVLVVNSCHLASVAGPARQRWLPIFWALDYFKSSQADEARSSGWHMAAVNDSLVPAAEHAGPMFIDAMERWDVEQADAAIAGLVRTAGAMEVFHVLARYAARDYRSIGHKAIYLANSWRTLQVIGWQYAEPVLRSLTCALLNHHGEPNPADNDLDADRPWRANAEKIAHIPATWLSGRLDDGATTALIGSLREQSPGDVANAAVDALNSGVDARSIWDGVFLSAGELLMRQPGIIGLHGLTTANAMHYLWQHVADESLRKRLLLQACSFNPMFRESARGRGRLADRTIEQLHHDAAAPETAVTLEQILADISGQPMQAAQEVHTYLASGGSGHEFVDATRGLLFVKGRDAHDYKFSSAVLEDYKHVSPAWRDRFLALSVFNLKGTGDRDNGLAERARQALG